MQKNREIEISDNEPFKNDLLGREEEIKNLTPIVLNFNDPLVLSLDSPWGAGKTTFVKLWQAHLNNEGKQSIYFNAWETDYADDPLIVLVSELDKWLKASKDETKFESWKNNIKTALPGVIKQTAIAGIKMATFGALDVTAEYERTAAELTGNIASDLLENFNKQSKAIEQFKQTITEALEALPEGQPNLVIFIDELDRCRPTYAIELLERIKHLFSIPRLVFVLSTDTTQLSHSIRAVYGNDFDAKKYLQRFIDLDYVLKKPEPEKYIESQIYALGIDKALRVKHDRQVTLGSEALSELQACLAFFAKRFDLKLRDINQLLTRVLLIAHSIPEEHYIDMPLLVSLLMLRDKNRELYDQYVKSLDCADEVIEFLCKGYLPVKKDNNTDVLRDIIGYIIATTYNRDGDNQSVYNSLIEPYKIEAENKNFICQQIVAATSNPRALRSSLRPTDGKKMLELTLKRIELVQRINAPQNNGD